MNNFCMQTRTGVAFDLENPTIDMINIQDIAFHLSYINRFCGAVGDYSVAQHSLFVCYMAPEELKLEALLHDSGEYVSHDLTTQLKRLMKAYSKTTIDPYHLVVNPIEALIAEKFKLNITLETKAIIKEIDLRILIDEKHNLFKHNLRWGVEDEYQGYGLKFRIENPIDVQLDFISKYNLYRRD